MSGAHWHLAYPEELLSEPVLWELAQRFGLRTNVRRANVEAGVGWVIVEVHGDDAALAAARDWLAERGVTVEELPDLG
ncbi:MAG TPA: NIL domain-containing protein [Mycobacteriales bacterium]|nr:NIL domain-containing protein [Mycobacteriales bacterium]